MMAHSLDFTLSNKYFEIILRCLKLEIFNEKAECLLNFFIFRNRTSTFSINTASTRHRMIAYKYLFDRANSRL